MSATAVFAEILVVGLQAEVWLAILLLTFVDSSSLVGLSAHGDKIKDWATLITTAVLALAYTLGVVIDRFADTLMAWQDRGRKLPAEAGKMRLTVMAESETMAKFLDYQRSRLRVARGTIFNVVLLVVSAGLYCVVQRGGAGIGWVVGLGVPALLVTGYAAHRINDAFFKRLSDAYKIAEAT